jgi:hypothetical protein
MRAVRNQIEFSRFSLVDHQHIWYVPFVCRGSFLSMRTFMADDNRGAVIDSADNFLAGPVPLRTRHAHPLPRPPLRRGAATRPPRRSGPEPAASARAPFVKRHRLTADRFSADRLPQVPYQSRRSDNETPEADSSSMAECPRRNLRERAQSQWRPCGTKRTRETSRLRLCNKSRDATAADSHCCENRLCHSCLVGFCGLASVFNVHDGLGATVVASGRSGDAGYGVGLIR